MSDSTTLSAATIPDSDSPETSRWRRGWSWPAVTAVALLVVILVKIAGIFWLDREARALRSAWLEAGGPATNGFSIQFSVGPGLIALSRTAIGWIDQVPPEAREALQAVHHGSIGVYELDADQSSRMSGAAWLQQADARMQALGWTRAVGVQTPEETVMVYLKTVDEAGRDLRAAVGVWDGEHLVVVSGRVDVEPLRELVARHAELPGVFAQR